MRNSHSFKKIQKELKRKKKSRAKLDRRQGKQDQGMNDVEQQRRQWIM
jgi:hypothetical protein